MTSSPGPGSVLVVDDDADIREAIGLALEEIDLQVLEAENGRQALETLRNTRTLPRLILLDLMMPVMNGWEFLENQQRDPALSHVPVVVMTAMGEAGPGPASMAGRLKKPVAYDELLATVRRFAS